MNTIERMFKTDTKAEIKGIWREIGYGASILVARKGNTKYNELFLEKMEQISTKKKIDDEESKYMMYEIVAKSILLDWKGIYDENEKEIEYSVEQAIKTFETCKDFYTLVFDIASNMDNYLECNLEESKKN